MRIKELGLEEQQKSESTQKEKAMAHLLASCDRRECLRLIGMAYDRITYFDNISQALSGYWMRNN